MSSRPSVTVRWRMTANGIARPLTAPESARVQPADAGSEPLLLATLRRLHEAGVQAVVIDGDAEVIALAFDIGVVDRVVCWIEPAMALSPNALTTAGLGAAVIGDGHRLMDVSCDVDGDLVRIEGRLATR